jgi:hypothetical protein
MSAGVAAKGAECKPRRLEKRGATQITYNDARLPTQTENSASTSAGGGEPTR